MVFYNMNGQIVDPEVVAKGMKFRHVDDVDAMAALLRHPSNKLRPVWIGVEGHDTSLPAEDIKKLLIDHFGSCGNLYRVEIPEDPNRPFVLCFMGADAEDKALQLDGSEMGGRKILVTTIPFTLPKWADNIPFGSSC